MSNSVIFRSIPGGAKEIEVFGNGKSIGELAKEVGIDVNSYQYQGDGQPASDSTQVQAGSEVKAAPKVKGN